MHINGHDARTVEHTPIRLEKAISTIFILPVKMQLLIKVVASLASLVSASTIVQAKTAYTAKQIFQFPDSPLTDIENVAIRPNGQLILSIITSPTVYTLNPSASTPSATLLHTFPGVTSCLGITEIAKDQYAIAVGNVSTSIFTGTPGTFSIWKIDLTKSPAAFNKIADVPKAKILNGLTHISSKPSIVLAADSEQGIIYSINSVTGAVNAVIQDPALNRTNTFPLGVNGIHTSGNVLYYTNSAQATYGMIPIGVNGQSAGAATVLAHDPSGNFYDDFALDPANNAIITNHPSAVSEVTPAGFQSVILNSTTLVEPTSVIFGLDRKKIYVVTGGGPAASGDKVSGQVFVLTPS